MIFSLIYFFSTERIKVKIKGYKYKVGVILTVNTNALRKDLEAAGIIKGLSSGF